MSDLQDLVYQTFISHLNTKNLFVDMDFNNVELKNTVPSENLREDIDINDPDFKAINKIYKYVFADIEDEISNSSIWKTIYAFPSKNCKSKPGSLLLDKSVISHINCDENTVKQFVIETLQNARDNHRSHSKSKIRKDTSRYFIIGDIGIGKSTFLKFVNKHYFDRIHQDRSIFWLTINLNKGHFDNLSIPEAIKFDAARYFRRFFFPYLSGEEKSSLKNLIEQSFILSEIPTEFEHHYIDFISEFEIERTEPFHKNIQNCLIKYIEERYPTIYIIDGLDNLSGKKGFQRKLDDVKNIVSDSYRKGVFFFVMRKESHFMFLKEMIDVKNSSELAKLSNKIKRLEVRPAQLFDIVFKRFEIILQEWENIVYTHRSSILNQDKEPENVISSKAKILINELGKHSIKDIKSIRAYFGLLMVFLYRGIRPEEDIDFNSWSIEESIKALKELVGTNFRKLMDSVNSIHQAFMESAIYAGISPKEIIRIFELLSSQKNNFFKTGNPYVQRYNELMKRDYRVIPLLLEGNSHYRHPYSYSYNEAEKKLKMKENWDFSKIIFSVFYPVNSINHVTSYNLLLKVRILQYLLMYGESDTTREDIINFINRHFPYSEGDTEIALEELFNSGLINIEILPDGYSVQLNRTGRNHITYLIHDFGYLRIILDDMLVPQGFKHYFQDPCHKLYKTNKEKWIISQIPRVSLFISLITVMESWDLSKLSESESKKWRIESDIINSVTNRIFRICKRPDPDLVLLNMAFRKYVSNYDYDSTT